MDISSLLHLYQRPVARLSFRRIIRGPEGLFGHSEHLRSSLPLKTRPIPSCNSHTELWKNITAKFRQSLSKYSAAHPKFGAIFPPTIPETCQECFSTTL